MATIRTDLVGVVYAGGRILRAGDEIPAGVTVGSHLQTRQKPASQRTKKAPVQPVTVPEGTADDVDQS